MKIFKIRRIPSICKLFFVFIVLYCNIMPVAHSQEKDIISYPATAITDLVKYSNAVVKNNLNHEGKVFGFHNGEGRFVRDFLPNETFSFEILDYDSIQFYSEFSVDGTAFVVDGFFLKVKENQPFTYTVVPIIAISNFRMNVDHDQMFRLVGQELYTVALTDDVNPGNITVTPNDTSKNYIDVWPIDSATYQVRLKNMNEFERTLSADDKKKWKNEKSFNVGVKLQDSKVPSDSKYIVMYLIKKKAKKKKS